MAQPNNAYLKHSIMVIIESSLISDSDSICIYSLTSVKLTKIYNSIFSGTVITRHSQSNLLNLIASRSLFTCKGIW